MYVGGGVRVCVCVCGGGGGEGVCVVCGVCVWGGGYYPLLCITCHELLDYVAAHAAMGSLRSVYSCMLVNIKLLFMHEYRDNDGTG